MMGRYILMLSRSFGKFIVGQHIRHGRMIFVDRSSSTGSDRPLPKPQRRGAIIILGMLALARRSVVTERVDTLLRVGLGPLGKVGRTCSQDQYVN
jgi:hypothetical protein